MKALKLGRECIIGKGVLTLKHYIGCVYPSRSVKILIVVYQLRRMM